MKLIFTLFVSILFVCNGNAQPGTLDSSFGENGQVVSETYEGRAYASLLQPDGKILLGGSGTYYEGNKLLKGSLLVRYNTDGTLDLNFADSGRGVYILGDTGYYIPTIRSMALQPDGKIVALGDFAEQNGFLGSTSLMRFNNDGSADHSFGIGGLTVTGISGGPDRPKDVALLPDGRIVVVGDLYKDFYEFDHSFIACYTPEGVLDKSFGDAGIVVLTDQISAVNSVVITADGKIVAGGAGLGGEVLVRYNNDGTADLSFGENGLATMPFENSGYPGLNDIVINKDGKITTGGTFYLQTGKRAILISRFTEDGYPDISFSDNGYTYTQYKTGSAFGNCIAVQENGKSVVGGYHTVGESGVFTVIRYNANGNLDSSFGINGVQNTFFFGQDIAYSINIQPDGKIVLAGQAELQTESKVEIARYYGDENRKQIVIAKIRRWLKYHNGIVWDNIPGVKSYAVQRSADGVRWSTVYRSPFTPNSQSTVNYYNDASPLPGTNYYRLQTTSVDGAVAYSNVIPVPPHAGAINNEPSTISLSPNPAKNVLHIEGLSSSQNLPTGRQVKITVVDLNGNVACSVQLSANSSSYNINIAALKPGNYWLKLEVNGEVVTKQFVKE
jgi:uncharacterized delta-60 repeat protein